MPASSSLDPRESEAAVRAAVIRLARPSRDGSAVIERAAILAEGTPSAAIEAWVLEHGGRPEAAIADVPKKGNYGLGRDPRMNEGVRAPRRYVLPAAALSVIS